MWFILQFLNNDLDALYGDSCLKVVTQVTYVTVKQGVSGSITFTLPDNIATGYVIIAVLGIQTPQSSIMRIANWMINGRSLQLTIAPPSGWTGTETSVPYYLRFLMYNNAKVEYLK